MTFIWHPTFFDCLLFEFFISTYKTSCLLGKAQHEAASQLAAATSNDDEANSRPQHDDSKGQDSPLIIIQRFHLRCFWTVYHWQQHYSPDAKDELQEVDASISVLSYLLFDEHMYQEEESQAIHGEVSKHPDVQRLSQQLLHSEPFVVQGKANDDVGNNICQLRDQFKSLFLHLLLFLLLVCQLWLFYSTFKVYFVDLVLNSCHFLNFVLF